MPFKSVAQQGFLEAHPEKVGGKEKLKEWEHATDFSKLPKHVKKGKTMSSPYDVLKSKKKKEIKKHEYSKSHNGGHVVTHKHHAPHDSEAHDEMHTFADAPDAMKHMTDNQPMAAPSPEPEAQPAAGAAMPGAGAAMPGM